MFEDGIGPALKITIAHARIGTNEVKRLEAGQATGVLQVDLSFKEPIFNAGEAQLEKPAVNIRTYALEEVVAEKFRALLQQPERNRERRQDVFDLAWLARMTADTLSDQERQNILGALIQKSAARGINPTAASMDDPEVARRAATRWNTLSTELPSGLPPFNETFEIARAFYRSLPWL